MAVVEWLQRLLLTFLEEVCHTTLISHRQSRVSILIFTLSALLVSAQVDLVRVTTVMGQNLQEVTGVSKLIGLKAMETVEDKLLFMIFQALEIMDALLGDVRLAIIIMDRIASI
jgi:Holliday junction resolvasome RuvABC endonuclease subunit